MQYLKCSVAVIMTAVFLPAVSAQLPLFREQFALTNRFIELKAMNNSGDLLISLMQVNGRGDGENVEAPALLVGPGERTISLYPIGTPNIDNVYVSGLSEKREDGGIYVAGTAIMQDGFRRAALWNVAADGTFTFRTMPNIILPPDSLSPGEQSRSAGVSVNRAGVLVGSGASHLASLATIWRPPYANAVRYLLSTGSSFDKIDDSEMLMANGVEFDHGNSNNRYAAAVMVEGGIPIEIPLPELPPATLYPNTANSMSGSWVAGDVRLQSGTMAFAWKRGASSVIRLPSPAEVPATDSADVQAMSINSSGHAVGYRNGGSYSTLPIFWHYDGERHSASFFHELVAGDRYPAYRAEYGPLINDQNQVAFSSREWNQMILRVYRPVTNAFVEFVNESAWAQEEDRKIEIPVQVRRAAGFSGTVTLQYETQAGSAEAGSDFIAKSGTVTWAAGDSSEKKIVIELVDDSNLEPESYFTVRMTGAGGAEISNTREMACTVYDMFPSFQVRNQLWNGWFGGLAVLQGRPEAIVHFERVGGLDGAITFTNFQTMGELQQGVDFTLPDNLRVAWAAGESGVKTIAIPLLQAEVPMERPKNFTLTSDATFDGTGVSGSLMALVNVVPSPANAPPVIDAAVTLAAAEGFTFNVAGLQGTTIVIEKSVDGLNSWQTVAEYNITDGELRPNIPLNFAEKTGFFRLKVKE